MHASDLPIAVPKAAKRGKTRSGGARGGKAKEVGHTTVESSRLEQETREFLEQDEKLAEGSRRRVEAAKKSGAPRPRRKG